MSRTSKSTPAAFRARKRFGQHFLEAAWVGKLVDALHPTPNDVFLEIGPGRGALTNALAPRVRRIVGVEIDRDLAAALSAVVAPNVHVATADILDVDLDTLLLHEPQPCRVVGNLPYNASSPILFMLLRSADAGRRFRDATLMLQKEVADRIAARPGTAEYGTLAVQVALMADVTRLLTLPPGAFRPAPKVRSAVIQLRFRAPACDVGDPVVFERLVRGMFQQRRKTLANTLSPVISSFGRLAKQVIETAGLDPTKRPQMLTLEELARLSRAVL